MAGGPDPADLLQRHIPVLRYDSQEPYFADAASEWTDNPGNQLRRADGTVIAAATPVGDQPLLSLSFLDPARYPNGEAVAHDDRIADPSHDYVAQAQTLHAQPQYANRVYGHWATGSDGRLWLGYWFFYFYNDYNLIGPLIKAGLHEGDWEMIQLRLDANGQEPDLAVYAQHKHAEQRPWNQVERVGEQPVVYPARGSHASYFSSGVHWTGAWFDNADGQRPAPPLDLESSPTRPPPTRGRRGRVCGAARSRLPMTSTRSTIRARRAPADTFSTGSPTRYCRRRSLIRLRLHHRRPPPRRHPRRRSPPPRPVTTFTSPSTLTSRIPPVSS